MFASARLLARVWRALQCYHDQECPDLIYDVGFKEATSTKDLDKVGEAIKKWIAKETKKVTSVLPKLINDIIANLSDEEFNDLPNNHEDFSGCLDLIQNKDEVLKASHKDSNKLSAILNIVLWSMICPTYFKLIRNRLNKTVGDIKNLPQNSKSSNHQDLECGWDYIWFYFKCTLSLSTYCLEMHENDARNRKELKIFFIPTALVAVQHFLSHFMAHQTKLQAPREIANRDVRNNYISKKWLAFFTSAITCQVSSDITQFKNQKDIPPEWKICFADYMKKLHGKEAMTEVWRRINDTCRSYLTKFLSTHTPSKSIAVITNKLEDYDSSLVRVFKKVKAQDDKMDDMFLRARIQRFRSEDDLVEEETDSDCGDFKQQLSRRTKRKYPNPFVLDEAVCKKQKQNRAGHMKLKQTKVEEHPVVNVSTNARISDINPKSSGGTDKKLRSKFKSPISKPTRSSPRKKGK